MISSTQKLVNLTNSEKYEILQLKNDGVPRKIIVQKYNISISAFYRIYIERKNIKKQFEESMVVPKRIKPISWKKIRDLEEILCHWFMLCKAYNANISGVDIQKKALELNRKFNFHPCFRASYGWVSKFRERNYITNTDIIRDFPAPTEAGKNIFKAEFRKHLQDEGCTLENVYNVVYAPIMWKSVPQNAFILHREKSAENQKMYEDYVTALFCANATGCHKLPILIISNIAENRRLKYNYNMNIFSTIHRSNSNAWIDSTIFNEWFEEYFLTSVKERQVKKMRREKTLLLLDNIRSLHNLRDLNKKDEFVTVMSIPLDVTQLIQPMNNGIIACFFRKYRREFVKTLMPLPNCELEDEVISIHKELIMWDCCRIIDKAWSKVNVVVLQNAWDNLLRREIIYSMDANDRARDVCKTYKSLRKIPGCLMCERINVEEWFNVDKVDEMVMKICTDEVLREFEANTLDKANVNIIDDETGPSHS